MKLTTTLLLLSLSFGAFAQGTQLAGTANTNLDVSNIKATIQTGGDFFCKNPGIINYPRIPGDMSAGFEAPKGSGKHTILVGDLWIGGKDHQNNLYVSSQLYRQKIVGSNTPQASYWPGPVAANHNAALNARYDKVWKITKTDIQNHVASYNQPGYTVPADIASWPGNGNVANGEAAQLAPYFDRNNDGIYSPSQGDYPKILGDETLYLILNDKGNVKDPGGPAMDAEIHVMYYGFNNPTDPAINHTVFSQFRIINRGPINLKEFYAGIYTDFNIGAWNDDFVGCDTLNNRYFGYNADNFDEDTIVSPWYTGTVVEIVNGYGANPPAQSVIFLDKKMTHFLYYDNAGYPVNGNPVNASDFYNYLSGKWKNNSLVTFGGNGTDQNNPPTAFMYPGDPVFLTGWSERYNMGNPVVNGPGDRRGIGSIGPFNLAAGQELKFTVAYTFSQGTSNLNSVTQAQQDAQTVQNYFRNSVIAGTKQENEKQPLRLFPNPATDHLAIQLPDNFDDREATVIITDYTGREVLRSISPEQSGKNLNLNISSLSKGIYQVSVISGTQRISARLVKI